MATQRKALWAWGYWGWGSALQGLRRTKWNRAVEVNRKRWGHGNGSGAGRGLVGWSWGKKG